MRVLSVASELAPWARTGGLGEVCAALPRALAARGHEVVTLTPRYGDAPREGTEEVGRFWVWLFGAHHEVVFHALRGGEGLTHLFVSNPMYEREGLYGDASGAYGDNLLRFALLARAACVAPQAVRLGGEALGGFDVLHAHDWHAALAPLYLQAHYRSLGLAPKTRAVLTIHNAAHAGRYGLETFGGLDLAPRHLDAVQHDGHLSVLKGGIVSADAVTAVSPTFAAELCTPEGGFGLHEVLRGRQVAGRLTGILNGIDVAIWDPAADPALPAPFSADDLSGRAACKAALQRELGLREDAAAPLFALVARFDAQKGVELALEAARRLLGQGMQLVLMGSGDGALEASARRLEADARGAVCAWIGFDGALVRRIFAGADFALVPSRFEPCGLSQLYAMRYGAVPIGRATGGLRDTILPWRPGVEEGTGWLFGPPRADALAQVMGEALRLYRQAPEVIRGLQQRGMRHDWSWEQAAARYEAIYAGQAP